MSELPAKFNFLSFLNRKYYGLLMFCWPCIWVYLS